MKDLVISANECIDALRMAGFWVAETSKGCTLLKRGTRFVLVPDVLVLSPDVLDGILDAASLSEDGFLALLSEAPTMPDLRAVPAVPGL